MRNCSKEKKKKKKDDPYQIKVLQPLLFGILAFYLLCLIKYFKVSFRKRNIFYQQMWWPITLCLSIFLQYAMEKKCEYLI